MAAMRTKQTFAAAAIDDAAMLRSFGTFFVAQPPMPSKRSLPNGSGGRFEISFRCAQRNTMGADFLYFLRQCSISVGDHRRNKRRLRME